VVGVSTLAALAMNLPFSSRPVCPVLDARKGEVYSALYDTSSGTPRAVIEDSATALDALFTKISEKSQGAAPVFIGPGLKAYSDQIAMMAPQAALAPELSMVRASVVGRLAFDRAGEAVDAGALVPAYLRRSEAEIKSG